MFFITDYVHMKGTVGKTEAASLCVRERELRQCTLCLSQLYMTTTHSRFLTHTHALSHTNRHTCAHEQTHLRTSRFSLRCLCLEVMGIV